MTTEPMTNADAFIQAAEAITKQQAGTETPYDASAQAATIYDVVTNLGETVPEVMQSVADIIANAVAPAAARPPGAPAATKCDVDGIEETVQLPPTQGKNLPPLGKPALEDLFGSKATDPTDRFFINLMGTIASIFSTFFGLGTIRSRELLDQFQAQNQTQLLSPDVLADMVERNILHADDAAGEAAGSGVNRARFDNMVENSGEPYGIMQALELLRRDLISAPHFAQIVAYSRVKTQYLCDLYKLQYETMSAADAVEGYVKGITVTPADFTRAGLTPPTSTDPKVLNNEFFSIMFRRGGGLPTQWDLLKNAAGDALGVVKAVQLHDHIDPATGKPYLSYDQVIQIIGRSRINPIFYDDAFLYNKRWFSAFQIGAIVEADPALAPKAIEWLVQDGYPRDQVTAYVQAKAGGKVKAAKNETEAQVISVYESGTRDAAWAAGQLKTLGYQQAAIDVILLAADNRRKLTYLNAAITHIRGNYVNAHITATEATQDLQNLGITANRAAEYMALWQVEQASNQRVISPATVGSLLKKGRITPDVATARWEKMGYSPDDAQLLVLEYEPTASSLKSNIPAPAPAP